MAELWCIFSGDLNTGTATIPRDGVHEDSETCQCNLNHLTSHMHLQNLEFGISLALYYLTILLFPLFEVVLVMVCIQMLNTLPRGLTSLSEQICTK